MKARNPHTVAAPLTAEGRFEVERGFEIAYRIYGSGQRTLLGLHGGPGVSSKYLTRLNEVIDDDTRLVLYDQLGSGDSDWPDDPSVWQVPRFVAELETVRSELELGQVTLYGQSWGGMLALAYTFDHPARVTALILSNTYACGKDYLLDISDHRVSLGREMHAAMLRHEHAGTLDDPNTRTRSQSSTRAMCTARARMTRPGRVQSSRRSQPSTCRRSDPRTRSGDRTSSWARGPRRTSTSPAGISCRDPELRAGPVATASASFPRR
jgi:proline-specific peptidase